MRGCCARKPTFSFDSASALPSKLRLIADFMMIGCGLQVDSVFRECKDTGAKRTVWGAVSFLYKNVLNFWVET